MAILNPTQEQLDRARNILLNPCNYPPVLVKEAKKILGMK